MPQRETKITSFDEILRYCNPNRRSMIRCAVRIDWMPKYKHHYVLLGHTWDPYYNVFLVLHYSTETQGGKVIEEVYTRGHVEDDIRKGLYVIEDEKDPQNDEQFDKAYDRFEERKGEQSFNISKNNCEHLGNYIMTGEAVSHQIKGLDLASSFLAHAVGYSGGSSGSSSSPCSSMLFPSSGSSSSSSGSSMSSCSCSGRFLPCRSSSQMKGGRYLRGISN